MKTIFTNGVFDILHVGHIKLLEFAKALDGDLIVGINTDFSVKRIKGPLRPIINQHDRVKILSSLRCVDQVVLFDEDTPEKYIKYLKPDILVKGPEASNGVIPGANFVQSYGGKVIVPDWDVDVSTTNIINSIRLRYE